MRWIVIVLCLLALDASAQDRVLVFAAASLKNALDEVNAAYGKPVAASYAASSALARQIEAGAPAHVFISADHEWMDYLDQKKLLPGKVRRNLLGNRLVWIVPSNTKPPEDPLGALGPSGRLALADPQHVPAGKYAKAALEKLGVWAQVSRRIAAAENVRAALALVARGEAPLGIVYETDALADAKVKVAGRIDPRLHPSIVYPAALLSPRGGEYFRFLVSERAARIFARHGFTTP
jgi:molybdate transport system substrate-binding protein